MKQLQQSAADAGHSCPALAVAVPRLERSAAQCHLACASPVLRGQHWPADYASSVIAPDANSPQQTVGDRGAVNGWTLLQAVHPATAAAAAADMGLLQAGPENDLQLQQGQLCPILHPLLKQIALLQKEWALMPVVVQLGQPDQRWKLSCMHQCLREAPRQAGSSTRVSELAGCCWRVACWQPSAALHALLLPAWGLAPPGWVGTALVLWAHGPSQLWGGLIEICVDVQDREWAPW